jgi:hypothetical protein
VNDILITLLNLLPPKRKITPSGWTSFNAVCCHHNGQTRDTRKRGGIKQIGNDSFQYHCFNCNFKAGWTPGKQISRNTKKLFLWLGLSESDVGKLNLIALKIKEKAAVTTPQSINLDLHEISLPDNTKSIDQWVLEQKPHDDLLDVIDYVIEQRKMNWEWYDWHWSEMPGYRDRVIVPFYQNHKIVGYTARKISSGNPKYLTESQSGYVFNIDKQNLDKQFVILTEGPFDAISIDGIALLTNEPNNAQIVRINSLNREVICVPDRDRAGSKLLNYCISNNWSVSLPPWGEEIKDVADAVKKFGRLYTLITILHYKIQGEIKIQLLKKKLQNQNA